MVSLSKKQKQITHQLKNILPFEKTNKDRVVIRIYEREILESYILGIYEQGVKDGKKILMRQIDNLR